MPDDQRGPENKVVDLMDALERSVREARDARRGRAETVAAHCKHCGSEALTKTAEKAGMSVTALGIFRCADCNGESVIWPEDLS